MKLQSIFAVTTSAMGVLAVFPTAAIDKATDKTNFAVFNICRVEQYVESPEGREHITIQNGMGDGGFAIATTSKQAQQWFNYGVKLFHAFYHHDNRLAFDKAAAADPRCALCLWGQALSRGPTQNFDAEEADLKVGLEFARNAQAAARTEREKRLTSAMARRYSRAQDAAAERDFAADLLKAEAAGPPTPDLRLLAAEALLTAWRRGDHAAAAEAVALIEPILKANPRNTAAIHYYIHATEFVGKPILALPYAEKLPGLAPKASHLVHMPAHTYLHIGRYEDAAAINASALRASADHLTETATAGLLSDAEYYQHNIGVGMAGALMSGDRTLALKFADHLHKAYPHWDKVRNDDMDDVESYRFIIYARFAPARMLTQPEPSAENPRTRSLYHYARGEAFAALHDLAGLAGEIPLISADGPEFVVARGVLAGRLAMLQGRYSEAAKEFEAAAVKQDTLPSTMDPPSWWYSVRRSQAAALLLDGQFARAAVTAETSLKAWPLDPLALLVRSRAEDGLGRSAQARRDEEAATGTWEGDIATIDIATL